MKICSLVEQTWENLSKIDFTVDSNSIEKYTMDNKGH